MAEVKQVAAGAAGAPLTVLAVMAAQQFGIQVTPEMVAVIAPLLQSATHWIIHRINKGQGNDASA